MPDAIDEIYDDVTTGGSGEFTLKYGGHTADYEVEALSRPRKNDLLEVLPEGYFDPVVDNPDDIDEDELQDMDFGDMKALLEEHGMSVGEFTQSRQLSKQATEKAIDAIVDCYHHPKQSDRELRNMLTSPKFPDAQFEAMLMTLLEVSSADEEHREFRQTG